MKDFVRTISQFINPLPSDPHFSLIKTDLKILSLFYVVLGEKIEWKLKKLVVQHWKNQFFNASIYISLFQNRINTVGYFQKILASLEIISCICLLSNEMLVDKNFKMDIVIMFLASISQRCIQSLVKHLWCAILQEYFLFKCSASGSAVKRTLSQDVTVKLSIQKQPPKCSITKAFLKISQYLQENTFLGVSF